MNKIQKITPLIMLMITAVFMTACTDNEKNKLDNRVKDYWDAKINKDFDVAYEFLTPGWRTTEDKRSYVNRMAGGKIEWVSVKTKSKECTQVDVCKVKVTLSYVYRFPGRGGKIETDSDLTENWLMKDNTWYHLPKKDR